MALYRFLFAPVLLAVAVAAGDAGEANAPVPPPVVREAPAAVPPASFGVARAPASARKALRPNASR